MEQQPGPVNWAPWNPVPKRGMVRLWTWEALAHGADVVSYFRWRQATFAQEQMHAGLNLPGLHEWSQGGREAGQVGAELKTLGALPASQQAPVAIVYDYVSSWITRVQPQGADFRYYELAFRWYEALRRLGLDVDFVRPGGSLKGYKLVLVPSLLDVDDNAESAFAAADGPVLYGPRTGSKTRHHGLPPNLAPGRLADLVKLRILEVSSLRPGLNMAVSGAVSGRAERWREYVEARGAEVLARFAGGDPALTVAGVHHYLACWPDEALLTSTLKLLCGKAGLGVIELPPHIRLRRRGGLLFAFNYGEDGWTSPSAKKPLLGSSTIPPQGVAIFKSG
jgi:beta-galactosidase